MSDSLWPHGLQHARPPLSITISYSLLKLMSIESVVPSNHLILCHPLLLFPSIFPSPRIFSNEFQLQQQPFQWILRLTGLISLQSKGLLRVFSSTTIQKHWFRSINKKPCMNFRDCCLEKVLFSSSSKNNNNNKINKKETYLSWNSLMYPGYIEQINWALQS